MCDYSLMSVPNRLATEGEELVTHRFRTGAIGLASRADLFRRVEPPPKPRSFWSVLKGASSPPEDEPVPAVCVPPGARLFLRDIPQRLQRGLEVNQTEAVTFTQITAAADRYRDAVRFANGREVLLQELPEDLGVRVLSLSSAEAIDPAREVLARVR